jgi:hypothetical protein
MKRKSEMEKPKESVYIALFTMHERGGWCPAPLVAFLLDTMRRKDGRQIQARQIDNVVPHDCARNQAAQDFMESGAEWLLMIDNDTGPNPTLFEMIDRADDDMDILVPRFFCLAQDRLPLGWMFLSPNAYRGTDESVELDSAATVAMFVRRRVFEGLSKPYFGFTRDPEGMKASGEDISFCRKARAAGFRVWGNRRYEVDHFRTISLSTLARLVDPECRSAVNGDLSTGVEDELA